MTRVPENNRLQLTALSAPPALDWRRRFVLAVARTAPQLKRVLDGHGRNLEVTC